MALVGYARVSSVGQSLDVQLDKLSSCDKIYQEKKSGASDKLDRIFMAGPPVVPIDESYWVVDGSLIAGQYPFAKFEPEASEKLNSVLTAGVTCFVDLTQAGERDLRPYSRHIPKLAAPLGVEVEHVRMPIQDLGIPTEEQMVETLDLIDDRIAQGKTVYVHCWGGIGRTGTVVGCYLMRHGLATSRNVLDKIGGLRSRTPRSHWHSPEMPAQRRMVTNWEAGK